MMKYPWVYINDKFVKQEEATIHISDLSVQRGYGIFDFLKVVNGFPIFADEHIERFINSAREMHLKILRSKTELKEIIRTVIEKNELADAGIRLTLTGGYSADGYSLAHPNFIASPHNFKIPGEEDFKKGIRLVTWQHQRQLPEIKTTDYLMAIRLQTWIADQNSDDVLYCHNENVLECPRANIFILSKDNKLLTPSENILKGITRSKVLQLAQSKFAAEERAITMDELWAAKEVFITSTTKTILPVNQINGYHFGTGTFAEQLRQLLRQEIDKQTLSFV